MKKLVNSLMESSILIVLLILVKLCTNIIIDKSAIFFYIAPIIGTIIIETIKNQSWCRKSLSTMKFYMSRKPIFWNIIGEYNIKPEIDIKLFMDNLKKRLSKISKSSYDNRLNFDFINITNSTHLVCNIYGVRIVYKFITTPIDGCFIKIDISSESPIKSFMRIHKNKLIMPLFRFIEKDIHEYVNSKKYSVIANKTLIPFSEFKEFKDDFNIVDYQFKLEDKYTNISINKNQGFVCVGKSTKKCMDAFCRYVLAD